MYFRIVRGQFSGDHDGEIYLVPVTLRVRISRVWKSCRQPFTVLTFKSKVPDVGTG